MRPQQLATAATSLIKKVFQFISPARMTKSIERFLLNLPDSFTGNIETLADFFQGIFRLLANTETETDNLFLPFAQGAENFFYPVR